MYTCKRISLTLYIYLKSNIVSKFQDVYRDSQETTPISKPIFMDDLLLPTFYTPAFPEEPSWDSWDGAEDLAQKDQPHEHHPPQGRNQQL